MKNNHVGHDNTREFIFHLCKYNTYYLTSDFTKGDINTYVYYDKYI